MAVERREKEGGSGGGGSKERNLSLVDVYDIAADIGKVSSGENNKKVTNNAALLHTVLHTPVTESRMNDDEWNKC